MPRIARDREGPDQQIVKIAEQGPGPRQVTAKEFEAAENEVAMAMEAALLISGTNKVRYWWLKEQLATNYLLGTDQYPNTLEKVTIILGKYQGVKPSQPGEDQKNEGGGLTFIQRGTRG